GSEEARPIISLTISVPTEASGSFGLFVRLDQEDVDRSSFWASEEGTPLAFSNETSIPQQLKVATILVSDDMDLSGDFNGDLVVDAADYTVWRNGLDTIYGPEHYGTWKEQFGESRLKASVATEIPEPCATMLVAAATYWCICLRRR